MHRFSDREVAVLVRMIDEEPAGTRKPPFMVRRFWWPLEPGRRIPRSVPHRLLWLGLVDLVDDAWPAFHVVLTDQGRRVAEQLRASAA